MTPTPKNPWPDLAAFVARLNDPNDRGSNQAHTFFDPHEPVVVARAPGRMDVMGGIADYSGALVLEMPTAVATFAAVQRQETPRVDMLSLGIPPDAARRHVVDTSWFQDASPRPYDDARAFFARDADTQWASYVAGTLLVLMKERGAALNKGLKILIGSNVPEGKGVSSSAALEVATMHALAHLLGVELEPKDLATLCQTAENHVVGAPCGIMDQITVACSEADQLLALLCQPAEIRRPVPIPKCVRFWGIDSGIRHAVSGADYTSVRVGAFMGYRILADLAGLPVRQGRRDGHLQIDDPTWGGYLANVSPSQFEQRFAGALPEKMKGRDFLARFKGTTDSVTTVEPDRTYGIRQSAAHPVHEHFRVRCFAAHFQAPFEEIALKLLGELMYQSHASYSACGLGSDGTNFLVELVAAAGPDAGLYGAKITGGGCGGTVVVLGRTDAEPAVRRVIEQYRNRTGRNPVLFKGSSPGAAACGLVRLRFDSGVWTVEPPRA